MTNPNALIDGYKRFYKKHFVEDKQLYHDLFTKGQFPKTLVIACSDSRVDPSLITDARPGDIFVVRNVANIVPPYQPDWSSYHGTSAALEFAVNGIGVEHIIVLGHSGCAGVKALVDMPKSLDNEKSFVRPWVGIVEEALERTKEKCEAHDDMCQYSTCEKEAVLVSLKNLLSFPWVKASVQQRKLSLHGWYFSVEDGSLSVCMPGGDSFEQIAA